MRRRSRRSMFTQSQPAQGGFGRVLLILILVLLLGGAVVLAVMDLRPEPQLVEKVIPNDRFQ